MKEDILEQLVEDWFVSKSGFFTKHNVRYRPSKDHPEYVSKKDSVASDIDILAFSPKSTDSVDRVQVVTCKSWQGGFHPRWWKAKLEGDANYNEDSVKFQPREPWKYFRELVSDKWIDAFISTIEEETGQIDITYTIAVTKLNGTDSDRRQFEDSKVIKERFSSKGSILKLRILTLEELISQYSTRVKDKKTTTLEATDVGRLLQLINASGLKIMHNQTAHTTPAIAPR